MEELIVQEWVTLNEACQALHQTYWQVSRLVKKHQLPSRMVGPTRMVRFADLEALCSSQAQNHATSPMPTQR